MANSQAPKPQPKKEDKKEMSPLKLAGMLFVANPILGLLALMAVAIQSLFKKNEKQSLQDKIKEFNGVDKSLEVDKLSDAEVDARLQRDIDQAIKNSKDPSKDVMDQPEAKPEPSSAEPTTPTPATPIVSSRALSQDPASSAPKPSSQKPKSQLDQAKAKVKASNKKVERAINKLSMASTPSEVRQALAGIKAAKAELKKAQREERLARKSVQSPGLSAAQLSKILPSVPKTGPSNGNGNDGGDGTALPEMPSVPTELPAIDQPEGNPDDLSDLEARFEALNRTPTVEPEVELSDEDLEGMFEDPEFESGSDVGFNEPVVSEPIQYINNEEAQEPSGLTEEQELAQLEEWGNEGASLMDGLPPGVPTIESAEKTSFMKPNVLADKEMPSPARDMPGQSGTTAPAA